MDYKSLQNELTNDPLARGYSGMTDQQIVDNLSVSDRSRNIETVSAALIFENIVPAEFQALAVDLQVRIDRVLSLGDGVFVQGQARNELLAAFGQGTQTRTNLAAAIVESISRAAEIGINPRELSVQVIQNARTGSW